MRATQARASIAAAAIVLVLATVALSPVAGAQTYGGACTVASSYDAASDQLRVTGSGFTPSTSVAILLDGSSIGSATSNAAGAIDATFTVVIAPGAHTVSADCDGAGTATVLGSTALNVGATATTAGSSALPRTGSDSSSPLAATAVGAVAVGAVLLGLARRRRAAIAA